MQKSKIVLYSIILLASMTIFGCSSADRVDKQVSPEIQKSQDNNISNGVNQDNNISEEEDPPTIDPNINDPLANSASTTYIAELATNKEVISSDNSAIISYSIKDIFSEELATTDSIDKVTLRVDGDYLNFIDQKGNYSTKATLQNSKGTIVIKSLTKSGITYW